MKVIKKSMVLGETGIVIDTPSLLHAYDRAFSGYTMVNIFYADFSSSCTQVAQSKFLWPSWTPLHCFEAQESGKCVHFPVITGVFIVPFI